MWLLKLLHLILMRTLWSLPPEAAYSGMRVHARQQAQPWIRNDHALTHPLVLMLMSQPLLSPRWCAEHFLAPFFACNCGGQCRCLGTFEMPERSTVVVFREFCCKSLMTAPVNMCLNHAAMNHSLGVKEFTKKLVVQALCCTTLTSEPLFC